MTHQPIILAAVLAAVALPAHADKALAEKKSCLACHAIEQKVIGPSFKEVAAKYAGQADAPAKLAEKVRKGGAGVWGQMAMPANDVTPEEAQKLVAWVLSQK